MTYSNQTNIGERELAAINATAEASLAFEADAWDDAVDAAAADCALLCETFLMSADGELE